MGMFDDINYECACDNCGGKVRGFQSKSGDCSLDVLSPLEVDNFYASCSECGCWVEFNQEGNKYRKTTYRKRKEILKDRLIEFIPDVKEVPVEE